MPIWRGEKMKKIVIALLVLLLSACSSVTKNDGSDVMGTDDIQISLRYYADTVTEKSYKEIEKKFGLFPSMIYIDSNYKKIGWIFEGGMFGCLCEDDSNQSFLFNDKNQTFYYYDDGLGVMREMYASLYFGEMTLISEGVYEVQGEFCPSYEVANKGLELANNVDFYVVVKADTMSIVLEDLTLTELENYVSDSYYMLVSQE